MSFAEKLRSLRVSQEIKDAVLRSEVAEQGALRQIELEEKRASLAKLVEFTNKRLTPLLSTVNNEYLQGDGKIEISTRETYTEKGERSGDVVLLSLKWSIREHRSWEQLEITSFPDYIVLEGGDYNDETELAKMEFSFEDEDWEKKLKEGILRYLSTPGACSVVLGTYKPQEDN